MGEWIPVNGTYRGGVESLSIHKYLIPVWYQSLGILLPKVVLPHVDGWSTGPPGFGVSHVLSKHLLFQSFLASAFHFQSNFTMKFVIFQASPYSFSLSFQLSPISKVFSS